MNPSTKFVCGLLVASTSAMLSSGALAADKLPTGYGDPNNDIQSGDVDGLTWTGAARSYRIGDDVILVFTDTTAGNCSFTIADGYQVDGRYLLVGGGGAGGSAHNGADVNLVGSGGGAGGFLTGSLKMEPAEYSVTVGAGGKAKITGSWDRGDCGGDSCITYASGQPILAKGGGAGGSGSGNTTNLSGMNGGSGGGAGKYTDSAVGTPGQGTEGQGCAGGRVTGNAGYGGGGGGAGEAGGNAVSASTDAIWVGGEGGDGKESDITGESLYYAGGGAGGSSEWYGGGSGQEKLVQGGLGGGGYSHISSTVEIATAGVDGLGGGGAGAVIRNNSGDGHWAGNGGNGVVVVRLTLPKPDVIEGLSFTGASEYFNLGEGDNRETVLVFKNTEKAGTFTLDGDADVRVLLVGGGGAGGYEGAGNLVGGGGGAGGFVEVDNVELGIGTYSVTVGKGGEPAGNKDWWDNANPNNNGTDSTLTGLKGELYRAIGGGAGGIANGNVRQNLARGKDGGSGGGSGSCGGNPASAVGQGQNGQGYNGGNAKGGGAYRAAGGGGGAGASAVDAPSADTSSAGGDGKVSDITGEDVWYAGGGAGGAWANYVTDKTIAGGKGGGGKAVIHIGGTSDDIVPTSYDGEDGKGGGGAGSSGADGAHGRNVGGLAGRGGNGVVIVRVKKIYPNEPLPGVSFEGAAKWYNLGHGKTRETVVIYTNVNEVGKLTLGRRATARVLLVGGGGAGGASDNFSNHVAVGGGGGAGGMVTNELAGTLLTRGTYNIVVGKGGEPSSSVRTISANGSDSYMTRNGQDVFPRAKGGGAGANPVPDWGNPESYGVAGGSGGGGAVKVGYSRTGGEGTAGQGNNGGGSWNADGSAEYTGAGGGGGAGAKGQGAQSKDKSGVGGAGLPCDITGEDVWYAGGGAGGAYCYWSDVRISGGEGGGGMSVADTHDANAIVYYAEDGDDGFGGGGAGASAGWGEGGIRYTAKGGRGGNGVVIVRITEVAPSGLVFLIE